MSDATNHGGLSLIRGYIICPKPYLEFREQSSSELLKRPVIREVQGVQHLTGQALPIQRP